MTTRVVLRILLLAATIAVPSPVLSQVPASPDPFRPYLFVFLAFAAGWLLIAAWTFLIWRKVSRLSRRFEEGRGE